MNRVHVDLAGFEYIRYLNAEPKMKFVNGQATDQQDTDENGVPYFGIVCLAKPKGANKPETITVKVPMAAAPTIEEFAKIGFADLTAFAYATGDRAQLSFQASKVGKTRE